MKYKTTTLMTKKAIAASLKKIMKNKPLDKITVRDIVEDCKINRKTFYYHFRDIYHLTKWIFEEEVIEVIKQFDLNVNYYDALYFIMDYLDENKLICNCAFDAIGRDELRRLYQKDFLLIMQNIINHLLKGKKIPGDYQSFLVRFYTEALASILINSVRGKGHYDKQKIIRYVGFTLIGSIEHALNHAEKEL